MPIALNHISIRSNDLDACERFYCGLLGLQVGPRPPFLFPGLWLYAGDTAVYSNAAVHIIGVERKDPAVPRQSLDDRREAGMQGTGSIDHVAFFATGLSETRARLKSNGVACRERTVPALGLHQVFVDDPNGVVVELNFAAEEAAAVGR